MRPLLVAAALCVAVPACKISYKFNGSALDYTVYRTIRVAQFPIRAALDRKSVV